MSRNDELLTLLGEGQQGETQAAQPQQTSEPAYTIVDPDGKPRTISASDVRAKPIPQGA